MSEVQGSSRLLRNGSLSFAAVALLLAVSATVPPALGQHEGGAGERGERYPLCSARDPDVQEKPGDSCLIAEGQTRVADLLLENPKLYASIRKSVKRGQWPSIRQVLVTLVSEDTRTRGSLEVSTTVREYQIRYDGVEGSDEIDSDQHVAIVKETTVSDGYVWDSRIKYRITSCERRPGTAICKL